MLYVLGIVMLQRRSGGVQEEDAKGEHVGC